MLYGIWNDSIVIKDWLYGGRTGDVVTFTSKDEAEAYCTQIKMRMRGVWTVKEYPGE